MNCPFQLVDKGVVFPGNRQVSSECKTFITKLMAPEPTRLTIQSVFNEWICQNAEKDLTDPTDQQL